VSGDGVSDWLESLFAPLPRLPYSIHTHTNMHKHACRHIRVRTPTRTCKPNTNTNTHVHTHANTQTYTHLTEVVRSVSRISKAHNPLRVETVGACLASLVEAELVTSLKPEVSRVRMLRRDDPWCCVMLSYPQ
jgi:hypothetical protein